MKKPKIRINQGIPVPRGREAVCGKTAEWRHVICSLRPGKPATISEGDTMALQKMLLRIAKSMGIAVTTRKLNNGSLRVWRLPSKT